MTREEMIRQSRMEQRRQQRRQALMIRRGLAAAVLFLALAFLIYGIYSHTKIKSLKRNVNTLEQNLNSYEKKQKELQDQMDELKKKNEEQAKQLLAKAELTKDDPNKPNIYLTFDDGPSANTDTILDTLEKYKVRATFFTLAQEGEENTARYKRIVKMGNTLAMHSYTHNYGQIYADLDAFKKDVTGISDFLENVTGVKCKFYRFPGGSSNTVSKVPIKKCIKWLNSQGIKYFDWNAQNGDATGTAYTPAQLVENAIRDVQMDGDNVVLLMHDEQTKGNTAKALPSLIEKLQKMNYDILPISDSTELVQHVKYDSVG